MSTADIGESFLDHHGVKGMKWGQRKRRNERARAKSFGNKGKSKQPSLSDISDADLQRIVNRMNMEQNFARLTAPKKSNHVKEILAVGATVNGAIAFAKSPAGQAIRKGLSKATDTSKAVGSIGRG